jgi:hypothetical protein
MNAKENMSLKCTFVTVQSIIAQRSNTVKYIITHTMSVCASGNEGLQTPGRK